MMQPNSPLFPASSLTHASPASTFLGVPDEFETYMPQLPEKPTAQTTSIEVYIIPTEPNLFVEGFDQHEYAERPPTLLRGCLYLRVLKPSKIKNISLTFKGTERTDWPEGIPPKKTTYMELNDIVSHTWPFYQQGTTYTSNNGADCFCELPKSLDSDVTHLSLAGADAPASSASSPGPIDAGANFFSRNLSPSFMRRGVSPSPSRENSNNDLASVLSASNSSINESGSFPVGDYIYNFEHPVRPSIPESCSVTFGQVNYHLEANIVRIGTFKSNITARLPVNIVRVPSTNNMEENEPIVITRDWEDQLRYDIVIGAKSIVLDSYLPLAFRFVPLWGKVALHRIRVYLTENLEYFCQNKKVHRLEPTKKYLLLEHKAGKGKSLLAAEEGPEDEENLEDELLPKELEFQLFVPSKLTGKFHHVIHPNTSLENIQSHHWIKICLRISRKDPNNPEKRKHYEISIDSPLRILSPLAAHSNTLLPAYDNGSQPFRQPVYSPSSPPLSPGVFAVDHREGLTLDSMMDSDSVDPHTVVDSPSTPSHEETMPPEFLHITSRSNNDGAIERDADMHLGANLYAPSSSSLTLSPQAVPHPDTFTSPLNSPMQRPIHILRSPSFNPPSFDADVAPPGMSMNLPPPPAYEENERRHSLSLSPLRIDDGVHVPFVSSPSLFDGISVTPPSPTEAPIKDLLSRQLHYSRRPIANASEGASNSSNSTLVPVLEPDLSATEEGTAEPEEVTDGEEQENESPVTGDQHAQAQFEVPLVQIDNEEIEEGESLDLTDYLGSPAGDTLIRPLSPMRRINSRRSSRSSGTSEESDSQHLEQAIPLLNFSQTSINSEQSEESNPFANSNFMRNGSVNSLSYDFDTRRVSHPYLNSTNMMDLVGGNDLSNSQALGQAVTGSLSGLRNPRIKRHYQFPESSSHMETRPSEYTGSAVLGSMIKNVVGEETEHSDRSSDESQFTIRKDKVDNKVVV